MKNRDATTTHIGRTVQALRLARGMSQGELANRLGLSQARVSRIERGEGSLWAEELLALLALFNVSVDLFQPSADGSGSLQNALARFGAGHLREDPRVMVSAEHDTPQRAVLAVLLAPRSERWVTALAPVILTSADEIPLPAVQHALHRSGVPNRLGWLCANTVAAVELSPPQTADERRTAARARVLLRDFLKRQEPEDLEPRGSWDAFDPGIRSPDAQADVRNEASRISIEWRIESRLHPEDFAEALRSARASRR